VYNGTGWTTTSRCSVSGNLTVTQIKWQFKLIANQNVISGLDRNGLLLDYNDDAEIEIFYNGIKLLSEDYVFTSSSVITLVGSGIKVNDELEIVQRSRFTASDHYSKAESDANYYSHPTGAGNEHLPSSVSQAEAGYLDGVTSAIQTQLNDKVDDGQVLTNVPSGAVFTDTNTQRTDEEIRDVIGTAISGSGATTVTVNDAANTIVVSSTDTNTDTTYTAGTGITLSGTVFSASPLALTSVQTADNQTTHLTLTAQEGDIVVRTDENKTYCHNGGTAGTMADYTLLATPTDSVLSVNGHTGAVTLTHDSFSDFVANEHIDWTTDQGAVNLHSGNYTDTTYSVGDGGLTQKNFTTTLRTKLNNISDSANNYVHPSSHSISEITNLQTELDAKTAEAVAMAIALG
jgi:hypothetical protein